MSNVINDYCRLDISMNMTLLSKVQQVLLYATVMIVSVPHKKKDGHQLTCRLHNDDFSLAITDSCVYKFVVLMSGQSHRILLSLKVKLIHLLDLHKL